MDRETSIAQAVRSTDVMSRYDAACKRLLSERQVLAYIMCACLREYESCSRERVAEEYLEGEPMVGEDPVDRDDVGRVRLGESQDATLFENVVTFDVRFDALLPGGTGKAHIEVDLEAQNKLPSEYPLLKRAMYYCGRMLSKQGGVYVKKSRYDKVRKVISVWVCMNVDKEYKGTITRFCFDQHDIVGHASYERAHYDLAEVILICLGDGFANTGILGMLEVLFSTSMSADEKIRRLRDDYGMIMSEKLKGKVADMCNLSLGVYAEGMEKGEALGMEKGEALGMEKGINQGELNMILSVMRHHAMSLSEALDLLGVPTTMLPHYENLLAARPV